MKRRPNRVLPQEQPRHGIYYQGHYLSQQEWLAGSYDPARPTAAILFYRCHWLICLW